MVSFSLFLMVLLVGKPIYIYITGLIWLIATRLDAGTQSDVPINPVTPGQISTPQGCRASTLHNLIQLFSWHHPMGHIWLQTSVSDTMYSILCALSLYASKHRVHVIFVMLDRCQLNQSVPKFSHNWPPTHLLCCTSPFHVTPHISLVKVKLCNI